jgi:hypothetical protein
MNQPEALPFKPESSQTTREGTLDGRHNKSFNRSDTIPLSFVSAMLGWTSSVAPG